MSADTYPYLPDATLLGLREIHRKNLTILMPQASQFGDALIPINLSNQINSELASIQQLNQELALRNIKSDDPLPGSKVSTIIQHYYGSVVQQNQRDHGVAIGGNADHTLITTGDDNQLMMQPDGLLAEHNDPHSAATTASFTLRQLMLALQTITHDADDATTDQIHHALTLITEARKKLREAQTILQQNNITLDEQIKQLIG